MRRIRVNMRTFQHFLVMLAYLPVSGMMGPRILCTEDNGASSIELASVRCCACCPERYAVPGPSGSKNASISCDDDECAQCTDTVLTDDATIVRASSDLHPPIPLFVDLSTLAPQTCLALTATADGLGILSRDGAMPAFLDSIIMRV